MVQSLSTNDKAIELKSISTPRENATIAFLGRPGVGKTSLMNAMAKKMLGE